MAKEIVNRLKRQTIEWEKYLQIIFMIKCYYRKI